MVGGHLIIHLYLYCCFSPDVNPVCKLADVEEGSSGDAALDPPESFLLCVSEMWDKLRKQLTVGLVVSWRTPDIMQCLEEPFARPGDRCLLIP